MLYNSLTYSEKLAELTEIAESVKLSHNFRDRNLSYFLDENNLIFTVNTECFNKRELDCIADFKMRCFELCELLNKHFTDTTFYITHAEIDTENEYFTIADFETIRNF